MIFVEKKRIIQYFFVLFFGLFFILGNFYNVHASSATPPSLGAANKTTGSQPTVNDISVDATTGNNFSGVLKWMFFSIIAFFAWLITFAAVIIEFTLDPAFYEIYNLDAIYKGWVVVRDFLNILFIFFLLFSAFATIFQVSKYHIRSTWVMIIVMALLVNFSWPITRVVIDISNVAMTSMLDDGGGSQSATGSGLMAMIGKGSGFAATIVGQKPNSGNVDKNGVMEVIANDISWAALFMGIMFAFLYMVTVFAIAAILVIRTIAMAILLIISSVGFTMAAFPSTRSYSSQWWSALMKYAFTGPILIFVLFLSANIFTDISANANYQAAMSKAVSNNNTNFMKDYMQYATEFIIPIVILWSGIIMAGKLGDAGSSMVIGRANSAVAWGKRQTWGRASTTGAWVGRKAKEEGLQSVNTGIHLGTRKLARRAYGDKAEGLNIAALGAATKQRFENADKKRKGARQDLKDEAQASYVGVGSSKGGVVGYGSDANAARNLENKKVMEMKKKWKDSGVGLDQLAKEIEKSEGAKERALAEFLSEHKDFGGPDVEQLAKKLSSRNLSDKVKDKIANKAKETGNAHLIVKNGYKKADEVFDKMDAKTLAKQNILRSSARSDRAIQQAAMSRLSTFKGKTMQDFEESAGSKMLKEMNQANAKIAAQQNRQTMRDMSE